MNLQDHFNTILNYDVPLVLTGHVHTYERSHRLLRGYRYKNMPENNHTIYDKDND